MANLLYILQEYSSHSERALTACSLNFMSKIKFLLNLYNANKFLNSDKLH